MITLFIDTTYKNMMIAVVKDNSILSLKEGLLDTKLSSLLVPSLKDAILESGIKPNDIDKIMVVNGPGSFTGIRMGVTVAKTYAWALKKNIITISSLEVMASTIKDGVVIPVIDARHDKVYAGVYDNNLNALINDNHLKLDDLLSQVKDKYVIVSDDILKYPSIKSNVDIVRVVNKHLNDEGINPHLVNPIYLKKTEAEENLIKGV